MTSAVIVGSVAWDEVVDLHAPLRPGSHNGAHWRGGRIGGGAANTAMAMVRAGDSVRLISAVGADDAGEALLRVLEFAGVDTAHVWRQSADTTRSLVLLDAQGERTVINLARASVPLPEGLSTMDADWIYVRSADPALIPVLQTLVRNRRNVLAHVPPLGQGFRPARILVGSASDLDDRFLAAPFHAGRDIAGESLEWMVVTSGADGAIAFGAGEQIHQPAPKVDVIDSTGAGDVFAGGLMHALTEGVPMQQALRTAVAWGAASVTYAGTVPPEGFPSASTKV